MQQRAQGPVAANSNTLRATLSRLELLCLGVGTIIGSGIFVIPGPATALFAGPAIVVSFLLAALGCSLAGFCYAELASMCPEAGSAYAYTSRAFGRPAGWLIGWLLVLEYLFAAAIVSQAFGSYAASLLDVHDATVRMLLRIALPTLALVVATALALRGIEISARVTAGIVVMKVGLIVLIIVVAAPFVSPGHWRPFLPANTGLWGHFGWSGVLRAAGIVFYTYLGFDTVSVAAQEARRPQRDVPFALIGSLLICTILFILLMLVVTGLVDYRMLNVANPVSLAIRSAPAAIHWLAPLVEVGAMVAMLSVLLVVIVAHSRILYAMARDGLLPEPLARLHPKWQTPVASTVLTGLLSAVLAVSIPVGALGQMVSIGVLCAFIAVGAVVIRWRRQFPDAPRAFRTPWVPAVPIASMLMCTYLAVSLPAMTWVRFIGWLCFGILIYRFYGARSTPRLTVQQDQP